jgi:hypothetical protein
MKTKLLGLAVLVTIVHGCSGGSSTKTTSELLDTYNYVNLQKAGLDVYVANHAESESFVSQLPTGSMTYEGIAAFTAAAPAIVAKVEAGGTGGTNGVESNFLSGGTEIPNSIGHLQVNADFSNNTATGKITNIQKVSETNTIDGKKVYKNGYTLLGEIEIKNGVISQNQLAASFVGNLNDNGSQQTYEGLMDGRFTGKKGEGLYGDFTSGKIAGVADSLKGGFMADSKDAD